MFRWQPPKQQPPSEPTTLDSLLRDPNAPTDKQLGILQRFGCRTDVTKREASRQIAAIAENGWRQISDPLDREYKSILRETPR